MFDRFDVCEALYLFASEWHRGQWLPEYAIFSRLDKIHFRPRPSICDTSWRAKHALTENGRALLASYIRRARAGRPVVRAV